MEKQKKNKRKTAQKAESQSTGGWADCPQCGARIRRENLKRHMKRVHQKTIPSDIGKRKKKWITRGTAAIMVVAVVIIVVVAAYTVLFPSYSPTNPNNGNPPPTQPPQEPPAFTPTHTIGSGTDHFWTVYPAQHVSVGQSVALPPWVTELAASETLLICDHSIGCTPCDMQTKDIKSIMSNSKYSNGVTHIDLLSTSSDPKAAECFEVFDPDGTNHYIPLTIIVTKNPSGGYLWHSWEGVTGQSNLETWLNDAMYYHGG